MAADGTKNGDDKATVERRKTDPLAEGLTPGRGTPNGNTGMVSQGDMETGEPDDTELRRQRRDNINPSRPVVPEKPA